MTFEDIRTQYTEEELSSFPGDPQLRYEAFLPILSNLYLALRAFFRLTSLVDRSTIDPDSSK